MLNFAVFVNNKSGACPIARFFVVNSVILYSFSFPIAEKRKFYADVLRESFIGGETVHTDSKNLRFRSVEFGNIRLICLEFLRSAACERENVESEHDALFAFVIAELYGFSGGVVEYEVGCFVADFEMRLRRCRCGLGE